MPKIGETGDFGAQNQHLSFFSIYSFDYIGF